jgi:Tol biopolymer transport system component
MKKTFTLFLLLAATCSFAQKLEKLTVEKIMRDPQWMGTSPSNISWSEDSKKIYFTWNPENKGRDAQYEITPTDLKPVKVSIEEKQAMLPGNGAWNKKHTTKLYEKNGDIWLYDAKTGKSTQLISTTERESNPAFSGDESKVLFVRAENLYSIKLNGGELTQLTNFTRAAAAAPGATLPAALGAGGGRRAGAAATSATPPVSAGRRSSGRR